MEHEVEIEDTCPECGHQFADYEKWPADDEGEHELTCDMLQCNQVLASLKNGGTCEHHHQQGHYDVEYFVNWYCPKCNHPLASSVDLDYTIRLPRPAPLSLLELILAHEAKRNAAAAKS